MPDRPRTFVDRARGDKREADAAHRVVRPLPRQGRLLPFGDGSAGGGPCAVLRTTRSGPVAAFVYAAGDLHAAAANRSRTISRTLEAVDSAPTFCCRRPRVIDPRGNDSAHRDDREPGHAAFSDGPHGPGI